MVNKDEYYLKFRNAIIIIKLHGINVRCCRARVQLSDITPSSLSQCYWECV